MKILLLDIETAPNRAFVWGLWDQNVATNQVIQSSYILCWAAKWLGDPVLHFDRVRGGKSHTGMLKRIWALLDEADIVVHYNGLKFDIPTLNKEFIKAGLQPPSPYKQIDMMRVVKQAFRFESNKLDYVSQALNIGQKKRHEGFGLWVKCMENDPAAWRKMESYNRGDVKLLETLYRRLRPWIRLHPNWSAHKSGLCCPKCGSEKVQQRGTQVAQTTTYLRYHCQSCGGWFRGNKPTSVNRSERGVNIV